MKNIPERNQPIFVGALVKKYKPEILVITGHDGMIKKVKILLIYTIIETQDIL